MKRSLFFIALMCFISAAHAQQTQKHDLRFYITGGYNIGSSAYSGLDYVVLRYNQTHISLTKQLEAPNFFNGFTGGAGLIFGSMNFELNYVQKRSSVSSAELVSGSEKFVRDLQVIYTSVDLGIAFTFYSRKWFSVSGGFSADIGNAEVLTRRYQSGAAVPELQNVDDIDPSYIDNRQIGLTIYPKLVFLMPVLTSVAVTARPYYQFQFGEMSWLNTNRVINSSTYYTDPPEKQKGKFSNFGFDLRVAYFLKL